MSPPSPHPVLLIDGYNVIGAWHCLQETLARHDMETARRELIETLISYSAFAGYQTKVVFDAYGRDTPGYCEDHTKDLAVCYTEFGQTADTFIEKFCANFRHVSDRRRRRLIVATSDHAQKLTVVGYGAECISALQLKSTVVDAQTRSRDRYHRDRSPRGRFLVNSLDLKSQEMLDKLRYGLK